MKSFIFLILCLVTSFNCLANPSALIAQYIFKEFGESDYYDFFLEGFKKGTPERESTEEQLDTLVSVYSDFLKQLSGAPEIKSRHHRATQFFESRSDFITVINNGVAYQIIKNGEGKKVDESNSSITFNFLIFDHKRREVAGSYQLHGPITSTLEKLIPGIALGMIGMGVGEVREILVHPDFGYGAFSEFASGMPFWVKVELLDCKESSDSFAKLELPVDMIPNIEDLKKCIGIPFDTVRKKYWESRGVAFRKYIESQIPQVQVPLILKELKSQKTAEGPNPEKLKDVFWQSYIYPFRFKI